MYKRLRMLVVIAFVLAAAMITYRRSATPGRQWKSWNYWGGALHNSCSVKRGHLSLIVCILISINSEDAEQLFCETFGPTGGSQNNINTSWRRNYSSISIRTEEGEEGWMSLTVAVDPFRVVCPMFLCSLNVFAMISQMMFFFGPEH